MYNWVEVILSIAIYHRLYYKYYLWRICYNITYLTQCTYVGMFPYLLFIGETRWSINIIHTDTLLRKDYLYLLDRTELTDE